MKKLFIILGIATLLVPAGSLAAEFEGTYELDYSELGLALNVGLIAGGTALGAEWMLPLETLPEDFFDEIIAELYAMIDENPWIPPEEKEELKETIAELFAAVLENWNALVAQVLEDLPETATVDQAGWPFEAVLDVRLDDDEFEWPGLVDLETGEFGLLPLVSLVWEGMAPWGSTAALHAIVADGTFDSEADSMAGYFANVGEVALIGPHAIALAGLGVGGAYTGSRTEAGSKSAPAAAGADLEAWMSEHAGWEALSGPLARRLGAEIE